MKISATLVRDSLSAHSVVGLVTGALMYLICLTGSLVVYAEYFERWEQPRVDEFHEYSADTVETAISNFRAQINRSPETLWVVLPTDALPRIHVADDNEEYWVNRDGSLGAQVADGWKHMLAELHINLHLPQTFGLLIVSGIGAMLICLIITGLLAHPRIFRDAFRLRLGGDKHLEQADLHNRLSVWGLPFHLMIAVTGAFFGLVSILIFVASPAYYDGNSDALIADVYGEDLVLDTPVNELDIAAVSEQLVAVAPDAVPIYFAIQDIGEPGQHIEVAATLPGRLSYSEIFRFTASGDYLGEQGLTSGPLNRQIAYSVYKLHFGNFAGLVTRTAYFLLGLALTYVAVSGINIWLARRGGDLAANRLWASVVWGFPLALSVSALATTLGVATPLSVFTLVTALTLAAACTRIPSLRLARCLRLAVAGSLLVTALAHAWLLPVTTASAAVNGLLVVGGMILAAPPVWRLAAERYPRKTAHAGR